MDYIIARTPHFMLVFVRLGAFLAFVPFFNDRNFLMPAKVALAFLLALLLFPTLSLSSWILPDNIPGFIWLVTAEILVGIVMGLVFMIMVFALQLAGRMLGFQMAFSMATVVDTTFGENSSIISVFMVLVGTMMIIAVGGDHYLLYTLSHSFEVLVPGHFASTKPLLKEFSKYLMHSFEVGFKLSAPAIILLLCIDITLGLIGKTAQKMQIFFVGLPLKIAVGLFSFTLILAFVATLWSKDVPRFPELILRFFRAMKVA